MHTTEGQDFPKAWEEKMWGVESGKKYCCNKKYVIVLLRKKKRDKVLNQSKKEYNYYVHNWLLYEDAVRSLRTFIMIW